MVSRRKKQKQKNQQPTTLEEACVGLPSGYGRKHNLRRDKREAWTRIKLIVRCLISEQKVVDLLLKSYQEQVDDERTHIVSLRANFVLPNVGEIPQFRQGGRRRRLIQKAVERVANGKKLTRMLRERGWAYTGVTITETLVGPAASVALEFRALGDSSYSESDSGPASDSGLESAPGPESSLGPASA